MGHRARAPKGREGRSQAGLKGPKLEVGARSAPKLLVPHITLLNLTDNRYYGIEGTNDDDI